MSQTITNDMGDEVEVFTQEEIETAKQQAIDEFKTNNPDKTEELTKLQDNLKIKEEELEKLKNKDLNFTNLRTAKEKAEQEIEKLKTSIDDRIGAVKKEIFDGVMKDHYNDTLKKLVGDDKDLLAKVELQYKRLADTASTKEEISKKLSDAFTLATGISKQDLGSDFYSSGGIGKIKVDRKDKELSAEEIELGKRMVASVPGMKLEEKDFKINK